MYYVGGSMGLAFIGQSFSSICVSRKIVALLKRDSIWAPTVVMFVERGSIGNGLMICAAILAANPRRAEQLTSMRIRIRIDPPCWNITLHS